MGCGTSKSVETTDNVNNSVTNGSVVKEKQMNGTNDSTTQQNDRRMSRPMTPVPKPVAFDIPVDDIESNATNGSNGSTPAMDPNIPKKLPPKRLLSLAEQPTIHLTAKQLTEKQLKAEEKRLEILEERKLKAHKYNEKFLPSNNTSNGSATNLLNNQNKENESDNNSQESNQNKILSVENVTEIITNNNNNENMAVN